MIYNPEVFAGYEGIDTIEESNELYREMCKSACKGFLHEKQQEFVENVNEKLKMFGILYMVEFVTEFTSQPKSRDYSKAECEDLIAYFSQQAEFQSKFTAPAEDKNKVFNGQPAMDGIN